MHSLGWDAAWQDALAANSPLPDAARVLSVHRERAEVGLGPLLAHRHTAQLAGRLRHRTHDPADLPAVGDWVAIAPPTDPQSPAVIHAVLPRRSALTRLAPGATTRPQVLAANVDVALITGALNQEYQPRRLERYVAAAWDQGVTPVVLLNKADLHPDPDTAAQTLAARLPGVPVLPVSAHQGLGLPELRQHLPPGSTAVLLGSSGVGKSTLTNALLGADTQRTHAERADDARGRHTTTARQAFVLPHGALLLDTPGLRELGLWLQDDGLERAFSDLEDLAHACKFNDCTHDNEPGCRIRAALADGSLDPDRWTSYLKLQRERTYLDTRRDQRARIERQRHHRKLARTYRQLKHRR